MKTEKEDGLKINDRMQRVAICVFFFNNNNNQSFLIQSIKMYILNYTEYINI